MCEYACDVHVMLGVVRRCTSQYVVRGKNREKNFQLFMGERRRKHYVSQFMYLCSRHTLWSETEAKQNEYSVRFRA